MSEAASRAVFLSYASQDAEAAKRICDALRATGVEVWFDQSELVGGDAWDAKIKKQIRECALFVPIITPATNARAEGYFRREWKQAVERTHDMADDVPFLFPIVIGDITDATARVPDKFREVQWTRLKLEETPGELAARIARLLAGNTPEDRGQRTENRSARKTPGRWQWWMIFPIFGMTMGLILALKERGPGRSAPPEPPAKPAAPAVSEARQLAAKARAMSIDKYISTADDYAAAEGLLKRALELDPNDGEVWAVSSQFNTLIRTRGFDSNPARREAARSQAERALSLAPDSIEGRYALARWQRDNDPDPAVAERTFKEVLARAPDHAGALGSLGTHYQRTGRYEEAIALFERLEANPEWKPLARYSEYLAHFSRSNFLKAEPAIRDSVALAPSANAVAGLAMLLLTARGDAAGAAAALDAVPSASRNEHRAVWMSAFARLAAHQPDEALKALDRMSADYIQDNWFTGPKAYWVGRAQLQAGRPEAARLAFESGLELAAARVAAQPGSYPRHAMHAELLAWLGRTDEALRETRVMAELQRTEFDYWIASPARIYAVLGRAADAAPLLRRLLLDRSDKDWGWPLTPALFRVDPLWDRIRDDPQVRQVLAEAEAAEIAALPPRDWPKNPELKKAMGLAEGLEAIPDDLTLAEEITKRVLDRSPTDVEAVTVMARLQAQFMRRGFDRSDERAALAKRYAERALQLAPDEPEAMYALATYHFSRATGETARIEQLLRRALELDPTNPRPGRLLADLYNVTNRFAEAIAQGQDNVRRFPNDVLSHYDLARAYKDQGRYDEFDRELDATLALAPLPNAIVWKARLQFGLRNDYAGMKAWLDRVPPRVRGTERAVFGYFLYAAFGGDPEAGLAALRDFPQKWFTDFEYAGPTALLNASLLELQGKKELALRQYEVAQGEIQRMRQTDPGRIGLSQVEFWTLLGLGRIEEAKLSYRRVVEGTRRPYAQDMVNGWWFTVIPGSLLIGERTTALTLMRESVKALPASREGFRLRFQIDPRMAPFRDDPEIKALLAEPGKQRTEDGGQKTGAPTEAKP